MSEENKFEEVQYGDTLQEGDEYLNPFSKIWIPTTRAGKTMFGWITYRRPNKSIQERTK